MRFTRRFLRRRLAALALTALFALALAGPAGARTTSVGPVASPVSAAVASGTDAGSGVSTFAPALSFVGVGVITAAAATMLTTRMQRRLYGIA